MKALTAIALILGLASAVQAQTQEERAACTGDAMKFCQSDLQRGARYIKACLQKHRTQISKECADVLARRKL